MGGVAATACGYATTTPSPRRRAGDVLRRFARRPDGRRRRDGVRVRHHDAIAATACRLDATPGRRTNRNAGPAPGARPSGTWPCSGPWPPSPSAGARPSPRPRGRRARTWAFLNTVSGRAFAASSTASRARRHSERLSFILGVSCAAARGAAAGRARQPATDAFFTAPQLSRRAARGPAAPRRASGGLRGDEAALLVVRTLHEHPFTATLGLETLRGAKAVALPARAITRAAFMTANLPPIAPLDAR